MQRNLGVDIHFEPRDNFLEERELVLQGGYQLVYANPFLAAVFHNSLGYIPVARLAGLFDETVLVWKENQDSIQKRPLRIASVTNKLIVHTQVITLLEKLGVPLSACEFQFAGTHIKALQALIQDKADLAFVFSETWNVLTRSTTQGLTMVVETSSRDVSIASVFCPNGKINWKRCRRYYATCITMSKENGSWMN